MCGFTGALGDIAGDTAEDAAAGSFLPGIGTLAGATAGVASGLVGMLGAQNQNTANQEEQVQQEQYNETMSNTAYQRATADMRAAGINPMLAYMQGGASSPSAPSYTNTNTLDDFSSSAADAADLAKKYQDAQIKTQDLEQQQIETQIKGETAGSKISQASSEAQSAGSRAQSAAAAAHVATATQQNDIESSNAQTAKAKADAHSAGVDSDWATTDHWMKAVNSGASTAKDAVEMLGIGKFLKSGLNSKKPSPNAKWVDKTTTGTFDKNTGEIHGD